MVKLNFNITNLLQRLDDGGMTEGGMTDRKLGVAVAVQVKALKREIRCILGTSNKLYKF